MAAYLAAPDLNPLDWSSWPFVFLIVIALLLYFLVAWPPSTAARMAKESLIIIPAVFLYFLVRGLVGSEMDVAVRHGQQIIDLERSLGIFIEQDLQQAILGSAWRVDVLNWIYIWAHWPVIAIVFAYLILRHPERYPIYRNAILISGVAGMIIFALYPVAPPRLMPGYEFVDTVTQQSNSYRVLQPPALTNPYAAMPSLHFGWDLLVGIALVREATRPLVRVTGAILPVAMFLAVVLTANHYILDAVAGGTLVLISLAFTYALHKGTINLRGIAARFAGGAPRERHIAPFERERINEKASDALDLRSIQTPPATSFFSDGIERKPYVIAHRFGNSISTLRMAEQAGVDVVEADVWLYRGRLEVRHSKTLGQVPVLWDRWSLEPGWRPRFQFEDLLQATSPETMLMLDIKGRNPAIAGRVIESLMRFAPGREVLVCSQNWQQIERFRGYTPAIPVHSIGNHWQLRRAREQLHGDEHIAISIQLRLLDERVVRDLKQVVPTVITWPVNSAEQIQQVINWGVDGFTSDKLDLMAGFIRNRSEIKREGAIASVRTELGPLQ